MAKTLGILFTLTTYGTWLRGDRRGWVDEGVILTSDSNLEQRDRARMKHEPFRFEAGQLVLIGGMIGRSLQERLQVTVLAMTVQSWHVHLVTAATRVPVPEIVKCAKEAVRYGLRPGRPIWTDGYDKRFCFDEASLRNRIQYVERHNLALGLPARPWDFIVDFPFSPPPLAGG